MPSVAGTDDQVVELVRPLPAAQQRAVRFVLAEAAQAWRDELRYILDPADVYGPDFPGETFRVLKEKEIKLYGEYRTRRLVLEAWDRKERWLKGRTGHE